VVLRLVACYIQLPQHICYNSFIDTDSGAGMTGNHGNTSGDMPGETSKPVSTTMSGWNVQKATNVFKQGHHGLDGDNIRTGLNKNLGLALEDREENIMRVA
jgi:hypothetical protein